MQNQSPPNRPFLIGITGGTSCGKTVFARNILRELGESIAAIVEQDSYYKNLDHLPLDSRHERNFDHPDAFDWDLLVRHARQLAAGEPADTPVYDYRTHTRTRQTRRVASCPVILMEGILVLFHDELRKLLDLTMYIDTDADIRFIRRLKRDIGERGRTMESVVAQYQETGRPMHRKYVAPTRQYADLVLPDGGHNPAALHLVCDAIRFRLSGSSPAAP